MSDAPIPTPAPVINIVDPNYQPPDYAFELEDAEWAAVPSTLYLTTRSGQTLQEERHQFDTDLPIPLQFSKDIEEVGFQLVPVTDKDRAARQVVSTKNALPVGIRHKIVFTMRLENEITWSTSELGSSFASQGYYVLSVDGSENDEARRLVYVGLLSRGVLGLFICCPTAQSNELNPSLFTMVHSWKQDLGEDAAYCLTVDTTRGFGNNSVYFSLKQIHDDGEIEDLVEYRANDLIFYLSEGLHVNFGLEDTKGKSFDSPELWTRGVIVESDQLTEKSASAKEIVKYLRRVDQSIE